MTQPEEPDLQFSGRLSGFRPPPRLLLFPDRVEKMTPRFGGVGVWLRESIRYDEVASVRTKVPALGFTKLRVESTGGHEIEINGMTKVDATRARNEIEARMQAARRTGPGQALAAGMAEEISSLADLRDRGVLTAEEFDAAKRRLLES
jgi:hypothetical protein